MARITESIIDKGTAYAGHSPALDLQFGGQNGYLPQIGRKDTAGKFYDEWISNQAYVKRNIIPVVLKYPKFLDFMPTPEKWIATYKALIELHPLSIDGLSSGLTVETDEHAVGGGGEQQEEITNVTRARSSITLNLKEKAGKSIQKFLDYVIRYGYLDPDAKKPLVMQYLDNLDKVGGMYTPDFYTANVIWIEPDVTMKTVVDAWLSTNFFFKSNGDRLGKRDIHSAGEMLDLSIECASITLNNEAVLLLADKILGKLTVLNKIPDVDLTLPVDDIDPTLAKSNTGFNQTATA